MDSSLEEFWQKYISFAQNNNSGGPEYIYRGVSNKTHELIPSIGRNTEENTRGNISTVERDLLTEFKRLSNPILNSNDTPNTEFDWLFLAQHYGLPTRLLDWSTNPLVALYFAVESNDDIDAGVYAINHRVTDQYELFDYKTADYTDKHKLKSASVIAIQPNQSNVIFVRPKYSDNRYVNQRSVFSCPKNPFKPLELDNLQFMELKGHWKPELRKRLRTMGVSTSYIYPGLDGIAKEVKSFIHDPISSGRRLVITVEPRLQ
ncbi:FRG domain-containing protein [Psychromonas sp. Urea-02u-13]|uniref:FRG domain-containing protein n=1 Tax=Psychromonas sp. Urea-02u-13 TaxID=2058326 RepID=UPI000C346F8B|nr:FRG domain-containing protein [Psychromonas sp. Urea-02u-13]PKG37106.1 FRG domain-containing protein [Psychromonas sp. Urea-02u-13]